MNMDRGDDPTREIEMIWTLFQGKEEEEAPKRGKEGVTVKILKFLFGSGGERGEEVAIPDDYREKRRFHRHVYEPSPRHTGAAAPPGGLNDVQEDQYRQKKLEAPRDFAGPDLPSSAYVNVCRLVVAVTIASVLMLLSSASKCLHAIKSMMLKNDPSDEEEEEVY